MAIKAGRGPEGIEEPGGGPRAQLRPGHHLQPIKERVTKYVCLKLIKERSKTSDSLG